MVELGIFNALAIFLQPLSILWCSTILFCTSELYSLVLLLVIDDYGNLAFVSHIYNPVEQEVMAGQFHVHNHPGVLKKINMSRNILQRYLLIRIYRGANNGSQHALEKNIYFIMWVSPHFQFFYFSIFWMKDQKDKWCRFIFTAAFVHIYQGCQY